jgi:hypothetical protein
MSHREALPVTENARLLQLGAARAGIVTLYPLDNTKTLQMQCVTSLHHNNRVLIFGIYIKRALSPMANGVNNVIKQVDSKIFFPVSDTEIKAVQLLEIYGAAFGGKRITKVEVNVDNGLSWREARLAR